MKRQNILKFLLSLVFVFLFSFAPGGKAFAQTTPPTQINGNNWSFIATTEDGRHFYFKHHGGSDDTTWYKSLVQITDEQFNQAASETFLTFARKDGQSFVLPSETKLYESESDTTGEVAGKIFKEIRFAHHQGYRYFILNGDPTRYADTEGVIWSLNMTKDWLLKTHPDSVQISP